jgi:hypothetical protein
MGTAAWLRGLRARINKGKVRFGEAAETSTRAACAPRKVRYIAVGVRECISRPNSG